MEALLLISNSISSDACEKLGNLLRNDTLDFSLLPKARALLVWEAIRETRLFTGAADA